MSAPIPVEVDALYHARTGVILTPNGYGYTGRLEKALTAFGSVGAVNIARDGDPPFYDLAAVYRRMTPVIPVRFSAVHLQALERARIETLAVKVAS